MYFQAYSNTPGRSL